MKKMTYIPLLLLAIAILLPACGEDDPVTPAEDHFEPVGLVLKSSGIVVATIFKGVTTDTLTVPLGQLGDAIDVSFLDEDQKDLGIPSDLEKTLSGVIDDTSIAEFYQHEGEEGRYEFHLNPLKAGVTHIELFILHAGHNDYRSGKISVKVVE